MEEHPLVACPEIVAAAPGSDESRVCIAVKGQQACKTVFLPPPRIKLFSKIKKGDGPNVAKTF